jgi:hypothetical protein
MIIISWDVGILHLAYCIIEYAAEKQAKILDWNIIDIADKKIPFKCKCLTKKNKMCGKVAKYQLNYPDCEEPVNFCATHINHSKEHWDDERTRNLFVGDTSKLCQYENRNGIICQKHSKFSSDDIGYCNTHYNSVLSKKIREYQPILTKSINTSKLSTIDLQLSLIIKMDHILDKLAGFNIERCIIENQPCMKNPKMKSIATSLLNWFLTRGIVDKALGDQFLAAEFMNACNKLKVNQDNTIIVLKNTKNDAEKYKLTKDLAVKYTKQLLNSQPEWNNFLDGYKKKDDLCDAYLQGCYFLTRIPIV